MYKPFAYALLAAMVPSAAHAGQDTATAADSGRAVSCRLFTSVRVNRQQRFHRSVPPGNYSGITHIGGNRYALVSDKAAEDGFFIFRIDIDSVSGKIKNVVNEGYRTSGLPNRDMEGIAWFPAAGTLFVCGEGDNEVYEYGLDGRRTGRRLAVPHEYAAAAGGNYGLESLTYNAVTHRFWTTTESTLPADGQPASPSHPVRNRLRLQSFGDDLQPAGQYFYETDEPAARKRPLHYAMGVSELCALDDGCLLVLEREFFSSPSVIPHAGVSCRLYLVNPQAAPGPGAVLGKTLVAAFRTRLNLLRQNLANYEGMCLGPKLADGSRVLIMVSDSQNRYKGILRDWFRTVVIR